MRYFQSRITRADAAAKRQAHRSAFDIERLVIFHHSKRFGDVERSEVGFDGFEEQRQAEPFQKFARLLQVRAVAQVQRERFEPARTHPELLHDMIRHEKNRAAVDAAGKATPIGSFSGIRFNHLAISSASAPMYRRPISSRSVESALRCGVKKRV